jgi:hypothetical protein
VGNYFAFLDSKFLEHDLQEDKREEEGIGEKGGGVHRPSELATGMVELDLEAAIAGLVMQSAHGQRWSAKKAMQWRLVDAVQWRRRCFLSLAAPLCCDRD